MHSRPVEINLDDGSSNKNQKENKSSFIHIQQSLTEIKQPAAQHRSMLARPIIFFGCLIAGGGFGILSLVFGALALTESDSLNHKNDMTNSILFGCFSVLSFCGSAIFYKCTRKYSPDPQLTVPEEKKQALIEILISETGSIVDIPDHPTKEQLDKLEKKLSRIEKNNLSRMSVFSHFAEKYGNGLQKMIPLVGEYLGVSR